MITIEFPNSPFDIKKRDGKEYIYDGIRKKWVRLTPEEWVRQNMIQYFTQTKLYPGSLLSVEKEIQLGELRKRYDIIAYKNGNPWMIVECKQPDVALTEDTLMQIIRYNVTTCCAYLVITNGKATKGWLIKNGNSIELSKMPDWNEN